MNIEVTFSKRPKDSAALQKGLNIYGRKLFPSLPEESKDKFVAAYIRDENGNVCAGVEANIYWDGCEIEVLWVAKTLRRNGCATRLMAAIEETARSEGAVIAFLKTFDAKVFYESIGYEVFGVLEDRPIGSKLYHMKKRLDV